MIDFQRVFDELTHRVGKEEASKVTTAALRDTAMAGIYLVGWRTGHGKVHQ